MIFPCIVGYPVIGIRFSFRFRHASAARRLALAPCTPAIPNEPNPKIGHSEAGGRATTLRIRATPRNSRCAFRSLAWESSTGVRRLQQTANREIGVPRYNRSLPQVSFEVVAGRPMTRARAGVLHTPHGDMETPVFMPVGTQATFRGFSRKRPRL